MLRVVTGIGSVRFDIHIHIKICICVYSLTYLYNSENCFVSFEAKLISETA
mgnify:FL=1